MEEQSNVFKINLLTLILCVSFVFITIVILTIVIVNQYNEIAYFNNKIADLNNEIKSAKSSAKDNKTIKDEEIKEDIKDENIEEDISEEDYIFELLNNLNDKSYISRGIKRTDDEKRYFLIDIDNDDNMECFATTEGTVKIFKNDNGKLKTLFFAEKENDGPYAVDFYIVKNKETNSYEILYEDDYADGICTTDYTVYRIKFENNSFINKKMFKYECDDELESKKIAEKEKYNNYTAEDRVDMIANSHTLKYEVDDKVVTEKEYNKYVKQFIQNYDLVFKTNENSELFDESL